MARSSDIYERMKRMSNRTSRYTVLAGALVVAAFAGISSIQPLRAEDCEDDPRPAQTEGRAVSGSMNEIFNAHNIWRQQWSVAPLQWNSGLAQRAQNYAN